MEQFNDLYPEKFQWESVDSVIGSELGARLATLARAECNKPGIERVQLAGLRLAMVELWKVLEDRGGVPNPR